MKHTLNILIFSALIAFCSCYDDKGNYDYRDDINDFNVVMNKVYGVKKVDTTIVISPEINQTMQQNVANLRFVWLGNSTSETYTGVWDTVGTEKDLSYRIDPSISDFKYTYYLRLYVYDNLTDAFQIFPTSIAIAKPYEKAWMILHDVGGKARLGSIEYVGDEAIVQNDAYFAETGNRLSGAPCKLGALYGIYYNWGHESETQFLLVTTNAAESGLLAQDEKFKNLGSFDRMIPRAADKAIFDPTKIESIGKNTGGQVMVCNGSVFEASEAVPVMVVAQNSASVLGTSNITKAGIGSHLWVAYDSNQHRFLTLNTRKNTWSSWTSPTGDGSKFEYISKTSSSVASIDPDNIGVDKDVLYIGQGYFYGRSSELAAWQRYAVYAYAKSNVVDKSYVFEFHSRSMTNPSDTEDPAPFSNYFTINTPAGVDANTIMTSSSDYNRILFYAVDNKIYKLDFASVGGLVSLIYQHPDANAKITALTIAQASERYAYEDENIHSTIKTLGAAFTLGDGTGEMVVLYLNGAGKIATGANLKFPAIQRYNDDGNGNKFGVIKDIVFI